MPGLDQQIIAGFHRMKMLTALFELPASVKEISLFISDYPGF